MRRAAGRPSFDAAELVGREPEQARVAAFAAALPAGARALLIRGEPGIGKTALWRAALHACADAGCRLMTTRAAEEEMALGLAGLVDLFDGPDADAAALLEEENQFARGRALLAALRGLAAERPAVIAIDDLQWLDPASARALRFALRRLDGEPIGVLATLRPTADGADPLAVAGTLPPGRCETLDLGPLGREALRRVLAGSVETISRPALARIHQVSAGNPLYAIELARGLAATRERSPGLRLPDSLQAAIARRLETVPAELDPLLDTVSALGPASVRELRAALPAADAETLLARAEEEGLLVVGEDLRVRFSHPLIGSVVYGRMRPLTRRALHASLAARAADPDVRARHVALSTDEPACPVAQLLEEAAGRARARGALDLAADFSGHSARLTPPDDSDAALRRRLAEIEDRAAAGELARALELADRLVATAPPGRHRAEALLERAYLEDDRLDAGEAYIRQALQDAGDDDLLRARVLDQLSWTLGIFGRNMPEALEHGREAVAISARAGPDLPHFAFKGTLAYLEALAGRPRPDLMAEAIETELRIGRPALWTSPRTLLAETLLWDGDLAAAHEWFEDVRADAARTGAEGHLPYTLFDLALVACAEGDFRHARGLVAEAVVEARDAQDPWAERLLLYPQALADAWLGDAAGARVAAQRRQSEAEAKDERPGIVRARGVLGLLALSECDFEAAAGELGAAADMLAELGFEHPGAFPVLPDAVEAHASAGHVARAAELLERLERCARAVTSAWADAACDRSRGVVALARGDAETALAELERAVAAFDALGHRPEAARSVFLRGRALLRAGRRSDAAEALADARRRFATLGATLWERRVAAELERAAPGRATGALTPAERRVAALVADGMKNREIGPALYMSVGTVEAHLTRIYRKLGIRSRSELVRMVADGDV